MAKLIGPVMSSGKFFKKRRNVAKSTLRRAAKLSKPVKKAINNIVKKNEETKYWAAQLLLNTSIDPGIHSLADPGNPTPVGGDSFPLVPWVSKGDDSNQRNGNVITPTKCFFDICATFNQNAAAGGPIGNAQVVYLVMYVLRSKSKRSWHDMIGSAAVNNPLSVLLNNGDGTSGYFGAPDGAGNYTTDLHFLESPIQSSQYTLVKKKIIKLVKNDGFTNSANPVSSTTSPNLSRTCYRGKVYFKLPKLKYDDSDNHKYYPTNNGTFVSFGYCRGDGLTTIASPQMVALSVRNHIFYKDA